MARSPRLFSEIEGASLKGRPAHPYGVARSHPSNGRPFAHLPWNPASLGCRSRSLQRPIGRAMTVRVNRTCEQGAALVDRKLRIYIRRVEGSTYGPQRLLMDWTDWAGEPYRFNRSWTAGQLADESFARSMSKRSDNTCIELVDAGTWTTSSWGACSASCGGGTQTPETSQACNTSACGASSCVGHCGSVSADASCWCDSGCEVMGDCCSDHAAACP